MSTANPLKRLAADESNDAISQHRDTSGRLLKRPKISPCTTRQLPTPANSQSSPFESSPPSKFQNLKLIIPDVLVSNPPTKHQVAARKGAAKRFLPRLRDPFPTASEIHKAYNLKLLRDYTVDNKHKNQDKNHDHDQKQAKSSSSPSSSSISKRNPIRPQIAKSARVMSLLNSFPQSPLSLSPLKSPHPALATNSDLDQLLSGHQTLLENTEIIFGKDGKELAELCFGGERRPWNQMVNSGIDVDDLEKERYGLPNELPEWRKWNTGKFLPEEYLHGDVEGAKRQRRRERKEKKMREKARLELLEMEKDSVKVTSEEKAGETEDKSKKFKIRFFREGKELKMVPIYK
ncbi:hypothetical protein K491DRAFT_727415 [Lophiostoma macrostomum CBS 122681]|uniref:Uncharacterized protein n=1 Tax=Lophiostoma macrostomum CBS 122681 TaxID=1314788 RepID=A0A6A6TKC1_9PLEO|nr:hypothetical protein K491DRAFT_727415 [Lophiostoma macrostomum CBS 122681]